MIARTLAILLLGASLQAADRPNVLFLVVDDLRASVGVFGDKLAVTPHIDALGARGTVFANAHCQIAICNPSRASVMTGMRPDTIRVWGLKKHFREEKPKVITLPQWFKQHGYHTHSIGKIYHGSGKPSTDPPSWSGQPEFDHCEKIDQYLLPKNRTGSKAAGAESSPSADSDHLDGKVAEAAIQKLRLLKRTRQPFFLAVGFRKPHMPFSAPAKYWAMHDRAKLARPANPGLPEGAPALAGHSWPEARGYTDIPAQGTLSADKIAELRHGYYAATTFMDAQIGRVLRELKRLGLEQNTVISMYSDHGFHVGEHNLWGKLTNYEIGTRVPLLIVSPDQPKRGQVVRQAVELLDLYPTLTTLCGLKPPANLEGTDLAGYLHGRAPAKNFALSQFPRPVAYNFKTRPPQRMGYSLRDDRYRITQWIDFASGHVLAEEFYDYNQARPEQKNQIHNVRHAESIQALRLKLQAFIQVRAK
ncbi:MAG: sulfatase [Limisphaerales bacterium]